MRRPQLDRGFPPFLVVDTAAGLVQLKADAISYIGPKGLGGCTVFLGGNPINLGGCPVASVLEALTRHYGAAPMLLELTTPQGSTYFDPEQIDGVAPAQLGATQLVVSGFPVVVHCAPATVLEALAAFYSPEPLCSSNPPSSSNPAASLLLP